MNEHLARHWLERALLADPRDPVPEHMRAHLAGCAQCDERLQVLARARAEFTDARFARVVSALAELPRNERARATRPRWPRVGAALAAAALAAAAAAAAAVFGPSAVLPMPEPAPIRYKGVSGALQVFVKHGAEVRPLRSGERLAAGDQLAFAYTLARPQHLLLLGVDDAGTVNRYFPEGPLQHSSALPTGGTFQLPVGIELDGRRGQERLVAFFSSAPLPETAARVALRSALSLARARGQGIRELEVLPMDDASQISVWFEKP